MLLSASGASPFACIVMNHTGIADFADIERIYCMLSLGTDVPSRICQASFRFNQAETIKWVWNEEKLAFCLFIFYFLDR